MVQGITLLKQMFNLSQNNGLQELQQLFVGFQSYSYELSVYKKIAATLSIEGWLVVLPNYERALLATVIKWKLNCHATGWVALISEDLFSPHSSFLLQHVSNAPKERWAVLESLPEKKNKICCGIMSGWRVGEETNLRIARCPWVWQSNCLTPHPTPPNKTLQPLPPAILN